jgi:hypothetical protein
MKAAREKAEAEEKRRKELQEAAAPKATPESDTAASDDFKDFIDFAKWYCRVLVFLVPILAAIAGKFGLGFAISLPGGAEPGRPTSRQTVPIGAGPNPTNYPNPVANGPATQTRPVTTTVRSQPGSGKSPNP